MKKFFALPLAVVFVAACSDSSTAPSSNADLAVAAAKATPPAVPCDGCPLRDTYTFEGGISGSGGGSTVGTELQPGASGVADAAGVTTAPSGEKFLGRFDNTRTQVVINIPSGTSNYRIDFDFYTIGSWDGRGKQAQHGVFDANVFDASVRCGLTTSSLFKTTFSNQLTVQQDYPLAYLTGGNKAGTGSFAIDALNYKSRPDLSNTPVFRSYGDVSYHMSVGGAAPCSGAFSVLISTSNPTQQSNYDESWGVDNIKVYSN